MYRMENILESLYEIHIFVNILFIKFCSIRSKAFSLSKDIIAKSSLFSLTYSKMVYRFKYCL